MEGEALSCSSQVPAISAAAAARVHRVIPEPGRPPPRTTSSSTPAAAQLAADCSSARQLVPPVPGMSRRMRPGSAPWSKLKRAVSEGVPTGRRLGREDASKLCAELLPAIPSSSPPPAVPGEDKAPSRRNAGRLSCLELGWMIGERYRSGDLGPEEALHLFDELLQQATPASVYAFNQLLTVVKNAPTSSSVGDGPALAISLFNRMAQAGASKVAPDIYTYSILIDSCCQAGRLDLAFASLALQQMLDKGVMPDTTTYTILISGYCSLGWWKEAVRMLKQMSRDGHRPDVVTYTMVIDCLCKNCRFAEARNIFDYMAVNGPKPNITTYCIMLHGYSTKGDLVEMNDLIDLMVQNGVPPNHHVFNILISAYAKGRMIDEALLILDKMWLQGLGPNVVSYNTIMHGYCLAGKMDEAMKLMDAMVSIGLKPNDVTYNILINGYCKSGRLQDALTLFSQMLSKGVKIDTISYKRTWQALFETVATAAGLLQRNG